MSYFEWALVLGFLSLLMGPFLVPLTARFVFRHQGVWLYRISRLGHCLVGVLFLLLAYMDMRYFASGYGPDLASPLHPGAGSSTRLGWRGFSHDALKAGDLNPVARSLEFCP